MSAVDVIGVISGIVTVFGFISGLIPGHDSISSTVRIAAGLNGARAPDGSGDALTLADGKITDVRLYDEHEGLAGRAKEFDIYTDISIGSGQFYDFHIPQGTNVQVPYVYIVGENDAICIPYVSVTFADERTYAWVGDWGKQCGLSWHYSDVFVSDDDTRALCTWIDANHDNGIAAGVIEIHMPSFGGNDPNISDDPNSYCGEPNKKFRAWDKDGADGGVEVTKRGNNTASVRVDPRLVISTDPTHSAVEICNSETSRGPDLVSRSESVYCNMETRETLPLCSDGGNVEVDCFDANNHQKVKRDGTRSRKDFSEIITWGWLG